MTTSRARTGVLGAHHRGGPPARAAVRGAGVNTYRPASSNLGHANHPAILSVLDELMDLTRSRDLHPATLDEMLATSRRTGTA